MSKIEIIEIKKKREKPRRERTSSLPKRKKSIDYQTDDDLINCNGDDLIDSLLEDERYDSSSSNSKKELIRNKHRTFRKASYPGSKSDTETKAKSRRHEKSIQFFFNLQNITVKLIFLFERRSQKGNKFL